MLINRTGRIRTNLLINPASFNVNIDHQSTVANTLI